MSIQSEIDRLNEAKDNISNAIENKGVSVPSAARISDMASYINSIGSTSVEIYYKNISKDSWNEDDDEIVSVMPLSDILETDDPFVDVCALNIPEDVDYYDVVYAWGLIEQIITADGFIYIYATDIPEVDIPIRIKCIRG